MEKMPKKTENQQNFHEIYEERKGLKQELKKLSANSDEAKEGLGTFKAEYEKELEEVEAKAKEFKISDFGTLSEAKKALMSQKDEYEGKVLKDRLQINYETISKENPEILEVKKITEGIANRKDFRMQKMFEVLNPKTPIKTKERNEKFLITVQEEINKEKEKLSSMDQVVLRQAELVEYKQNLSESGHICITPTVAKDLEAIGDRMLTGKPVFLHGPTGTGKTSLARFAASHFTGKDSEMVFCNPQTKESNVWGKTGIKPTPSGAIETVEIYGPLAKAMVEGKTVIFDEFTALPKEQMVFIKGIFNAKVGDKINIVGNGIVEVQPGFQMIFTANLKSEKNPERQDLPPEIAREFEQNNIKINYVNKEEAYDIMLARLLNEDGSLDMSYYDLNTTLPNLAQVMNEIQESYTDATDKEVARKAGALDASGKVHSLKKFVMTQGSVEAILSSWNIEKKMKKTEKSFAEFLDDRFKTALTFEEYSKDDRILVAKILASHGFLLTLTPKELNLPDDVFAFNTIKQLRGEDAIYELKRESGNIKHLNLKEIAEFDPFNTRATLMEKQAEVFLEGETGMEDQFFKTANKRFKNIFGKKSGVEAITTAYKNESINMDIEQKLQDYIDFYKTSKLDLPPDFENSIREIWENNLDDIQKAIEENGFDDMLLMPADIPLPGLNTKMTEGYKNATYESIDFSGGGGLQGAKSQNVDKPRIVLVHKTQNLKDRPELAKTLNIKGEDAIKSGILTLEDYLVFQRKYFKETGKHLDEIGSTWLATYSGVRLVYARWDLGAERVHAIAGDLGAQGGTLGARPSRSFF